MFGGLISLVGFVAVVVAVVVLIARRQAEPDGAQERAGVGVRRFFQYVIMLGALVLTAIGVAGLVDALATEEIAIDSADVARSISFVVVGLPVFVGLAFATRRLLAEPREVRSLGWAMYLTVALVGSLVTTMVSLITLVGDLATGDGLDSLLAANVVIWATVWAGHRWATLRRGFPPRMRIEHLLGSTAGLIAAVAGAAIALANVFVRLYDELFDLAVAGPSGEQIIRPMAALLVGFAAWSWYWFATARHDLRTPWWNAYVLLLGVLGGVVMVVAGLGVAAYAVLAWFLTDPAVSAAAHFDIIPGAAGVAVVGGVSWLYHRIVLGERSLAERTEVDRVYDYLIAGAGLGVVAGGITTLIAGSLQLMAGSWVAADMGEPASIALTLLFVGLPLWAIYWVRCQRARDFAPISELGSVTRRIYLFLVLGVSGLVAFISLVITIYAVFEDMLDEMLGSATLGDVAVPVGLFLTAGALAGYHFVVFRSDRIEMPRQVRPVLRDVYVVTAHGDDLAAALQGTNVRVHLMHAASPPLVAPSVDEVLAALRNETHPQVVVVETDGGEFELLPIE